MKTETIIRILDTEEQDTLAAQSAKDISQAMHFLAGVTAAEDMRTWLDVYRWIGNRKYYPSQDKLSIQWTLWEIAGLKAAINLGVIKGVTVNDVEAALG